ncbi:ALBINO3-like protein 1, chloroplastic [Juglans microcarpa x Juglans regia]|uniref:ALBINO3-like protein 1, chloroplastic n=1 Tax=Juglans microcarpa x Juglans regia TaxID=2249226 RepID=UPI001B7E2716|nr:ALBINO3-like protein 1, chloroplastic [Juglans microcarpa x Juglans regia]
MATTFSLYRPNLVLAPFPSRTATPYPLLLLPRTNDYFYHNGLSRHKPSLRGSLAVARLGFNSGFFPGPDSVESVVGELFGRAESVLYTIADAAVSNSDTVTSTTKQSNDWLSGITFYMESVLKVLKDGLSAVHVPYSYGFAIILLTVLVKAATFPLSKKQVESAMSMRSLQPQVKAIQERYAGNQEKIQLETARLYKLANINPLAGCLPTLATIPVWIGLYRALSNVADEGLLSEGFFWIPSLAGPTTIAARQNGSGVSWLFPFVDGHPPLGWSDTLAYLVLPVLLVVSQYISVQIMQSSQSNDPSMKSSQTITKLLPLMIGYFALSVPSGLSLYWFTNNILSTAQQVWLQKLGGAKISVRTTPEDILKEDQVQIQQSVSELITTEKVARQGEKLTSEGLLPGERFKQIKEQEARRRQQKEEKGKAGETVAKGTQLTNEGHEREARLLENENGAGSESVDENNPSNVGVVNGDLTGQDSEEDQIMSSVLRVEEDNGSANSKEAVEVHTTTTRKDIKLPGEDIHQARQE